MNAHTRFPGLEMHDGLWWPDYDRRARPVVAREAEFGIPVVLSHTKGRGLVVQAGGNVGLYPIALAEHFSKVITFEPNRQNMDCLKLNRMSAPGRFKIEAVFAALSDKTGWCATECPPTELDNCGAVQVASGNDVPLTTIDLIVAPHLAVDLIWLDIEGSEAAALRGAEATIARCGPTIAIEDKGIGPSPAGWLEERGYTEQARVGNDRIFVKGE